MRLTPEEKAEIIELVRKSPDGINKTLKSLNIHKTTFYNWCYAYDEGGTEALCPKRRTNQQWNQIPDDVKAYVVTFALKPENVELSSREIALRITDKTKTYISESSVYRILKKRGLIKQAEHYYVFAADEFHTKTIVPNQMWQTDFTYFKIIGRGWYYLSTVIDDYSRYIIHWELCESMKWTDAGRTIATAMQKAGLRKGQAPKLLSDNGSSYIAHEYGDYLEKEFGMQKIHGAPMHPQTQGKIERYHKTIKSVVKLHNYYSPEELISEIAQFVDYYNNERYHESLKNCTPAQVYFGQDEQVLKEREKIKKQTLKQRKLNYFASLEKIA